MKTKLLLLITIIMSFSMFGKQIDENTARTVGQNFLKTKSNSSEKFRTAKFQMVYKSNSKSSTKATTFFYVFNHYCPIKKKPN